MFSGTPSRKRDHECRSRRHDLTDIGHYCAKMPRRVLPFALFITLLVVPSLAITTIAQAAETTTDERPTAAVSLGDSYIAGEAGRWEGNSTSSFGDRAGTDRAAIQTRWFTFYNPRAIYGTSFENGCRRSDVAPLQSAELDVHEIFNVACSGASTQNVISTSSGGQPFRGEDPQVDQLARIASTHNVDVVALSLGGNDLGFSEVIIDCVLRYSTSTRFFPNTCAENQQRNITDALPAALDGVATAINDIHDTLERTGNSDYRLILQSYPAPLPHGDDFRYRETGFDRLTRGCPFWDSDADWSNDWLIPTLNTALAEVAAENNVEFLDLTNALAGREACAVGATQGAGDTAEWIRFVSTGITQGNAGESVHPNALGQVALGHCLALTVAQTPGHFECENTPGGSPSDMTVERR